VLLFGCGGAAGTETVTDAGEGATVTLTETETDTVTVTETVKPAPKPEPTVQKFSGNGGKTIRVRVAKDSALRWTNDGDIFQISTSRSTGRGSTHRLTREIPSSLLAVTR
jgi:PKD repeat protein